MIQTKTTQTMIVSITTNGKRVTEVTQTGANEFLCTNWANKNQNQLSHYNALKYFKTLKGAERFAKKFTTNS